MSQRCEDVELTGLAWLESSGWTVKNGAEIAPCEPAAERYDYGQVVLEQRLRDALTRPEGTELVAPGVSEISWTYLARSERLFFAQSSMPSCRAICLIFPT